MDKMTQQNAAMVEQSAASARSLATEAHAMTALVSQFVLDRRENTDHPGFDDSNDRRKYQTTGVPKYATTITSGNLALDSNPEDDWSEF